MSTTTIFPLPQNLGEESIAFCTCPVTRELPHCCSWGSQSAGITSGLSQGPPKTVRSYHCTARPKTVLKAHRVSALKELTVFTLALPFQVQHTVEFIVWVGSSHRFASTHLV